MPSASGSTSSRTAWSAFAGAGVIALALALAFQGTRPLHETSEGRYALVAQEMRASGRWLDPTLDGQPHRTKPPLTYWIQAAGMAALGENAWGARAPGAIALATRERLHGLQFYLQRHLEQPAAGADTDEVRAFVADTVRRYQRQSTAPGMLLVVPVHDASAITSVVAHETADFLHLPGEFWNTLELPAHNFDLPLRPRDS